MRGATCALALAVAACARPAPKLDDGDLVEVTRGDLVVAVVATGELAALDTTEVTPPRLPDVYNFKVASLAAEGSAVAAGDTVVTFEPDELNQQLATTNIDVAKARETLAKRRREAMLQRSADAVDVLAAGVDARKAALTRDVPADLITGLDAHEHALDDELARMRLAEARDGAAATKQSDDADLHALGDYVASNEQHAGALTAAIGKLAVTAPRAGVVVYTGPKVGSVVYRTEPCLQVVGLDRMVGRGVVDEVDVPRVAADQLVTVRLDAMPDVTLHGKVAAIGTAVQRHSADDPSSVVPMSIDIDPSGAALRPGMRFRARIEIARVHDVVQVPADAVFVTGDGAIVYRDTGEPVSVVLGRRAGDAFEVIAGLSPGDRVARVAPEETP